MEENQYLENKFREAFKNFERTPSEDTWKGLRSVLHPEPRHIGFWAGIIQMPQNSRFLRFTVGVAAIAIILFLIIFWIAYGDHRAIRGHAYAGESRLSRGTAYLFKVEDRSIPYDSVRHYSSAIVNDNGSYKFINVKPGKYLLRVVPESTAFSNKNYKPSWYDQHEYTGEAHLIELKSDDLEIDVHLVPDSARERK